MASGMAAPKIRSKDCAIQRCPALNVVEQQITGAEDYKGDCGLLHEHCQSKRSASNQ
jgi:hypothetical protein